VNRYSINRALLMVGLVVTASMGNPVLADSPRNGTDNKAVQTKTISFADLNMNSPDGASTLYRRIRSAAESVCTPFQSREMTLLSEWRNCMDAAISGAVTRINNPQLTAVATAHGLPSTAMALASSTK
jgi:UrcA family protein